LSIGEGKRKTMRRQRPRWRRTFSADELDDESYLTSPAIAGRAPNSSRPTESSRAREATSPTNRPPPLHIGRATESPLQVQLRKHEKSRRRDIQSLAHQLEAVYDHLEALDRDEQDRDNELEQRLQKQGETLRIALDEMAGLADRLAASEQAQKEAAHAAASQAAAVAAMAGELQGLKAHAETSTRALETHVELGRLRSEMGAVQQRCADSETRVLKLEASLERALAELERQGRQQQSLVGRVGTQAAEARSEHAKLGSAVRDATSAMEAHAEVVASSTLAAHARESTAALEALEARLVALDDGYRSSAVRESAPARTYAHAPTRTCLRAPTCAHLRACTCAHLRALAYAHARAIWGFARALTHGTCRALAPF
jgi:hypothetical protein